MLLSFTYRLCIYDDLMLTIDRGNAVVALDRAFAGGHLARFIVGDIAFHLSGVLSVTHARRR